MSLAQAFSELWPILATLGGGYIGLLLYIRKQFEDRLKEQAERIAKLEGRLERREDYVWRTLSATEQATALAQSLTSGEGHS